MGPNQAYDLLEYLAAQTRARYKTTTWVVSVEGHQQNPKSDYAL